MPRLAVSSADTIAAPATPPGRGAIAVARVSGKASMSVWRACFRTNAGQPLESPEPRRALHGWWIDPATGETIDEVVATFYQAPASFTGEDAVEIACHGSDLLLRRVVAACYRAGARPAEPGEFTQRAFENGKIDLLQARAVAELIDSETAEAQRQALLRLRGGLSERVHAAQGALLDAAALIEAYIDFPEEDVGAADEAEIRGLFDRAASTLDALLATRRRGELLQRGARVAIVGQPNAGKSSLFNALVGSARAIVSPHPGTTRDAIEARLDLEGLAATLVDTAGLRADPEHEVEAIGIERTRAELALAQLAVWVVDPTDDVGRQLAAALAMAEEARLLDAAPGAAATLLVLSKADLAPLRAEAFAAERARRLSSWPIVSARCDEAEGVAPLAAAIRRALLGDEEAGAAGGSAVLCADAAQAELLGRAREALERARASREAGAGGELAMVDVQESLDSLARLTGTSVHEEMLDRIFRRFCLGK
jgi:tRNA modification GTPase